MLCEYKQWFIAYSYFLNSSILDVWLDSKYASEVCFSRVIFNKIVRLVAIWNNIQRCMPLLNLISPITVSAGKYTLKPINSFIRTLFQISPQLTKKAQEWVYFYQSMVLLLSLKMFSCYRAFLVSSKRLPVCWSSYYKSHQDEYEYVLIIFEECLWGSLFLIKLQA